MQFLVSIQAEVPGWKALQRRSRGLHRSLFSRLWLHHHLHHNANTGRVYSCGSASCHKSWKRRRYRLRCCWRWLSCCRLRWIRSCFAEFRCWRYWVKDDRKFCQSFCRRQHLRQIRRWKTCDRNRGCCLHEACHRRRRGQDRLLAGDC